MSGPETILPSRTPARVLVMASKNIPEALRAAAVPVPDKAAPASDAPGRFARAFTSELGQGPNPKAAGFLTPSPSEDPVSFRRVSADASSVSPQRTIDRVIRDSLQKELPSGPLRNLPASSIESRPPAKEALGLMEQIKRYKEDQLLANPGGDHYHTDRAENVIAKPNGPAGFVERIGKDLKDAGRNFLNLAKNFLSGAEYKYRDARGTLQTGRHQGLIGTLGKFFQNLASGLSFGAYVPEGETAPEGLWDRAKYSFKKIFGEALLNNLIAGVPRAVGHMVKDGALGVLNLIEVIPDATIGNLPEGEKLVTETFDNAQVALSYAMDILPYGDAWVRVHSPGSADGGLGVPILYNLNSPAKGLKDSNWARVSNTPFRKFIETAGSVVTSALTFFVPAPPFPKPAGTGEKIQPEKPPPISPHVVARRP